MGLRDLIFESKGEDKKPKKEESKEAISFPKANKNAFEGGKANAFLGDEVGQFDFKNEGFAPSTEVGVPNNLSCEPHIDAVMDLYEKGFDELNQVGYDFYEFYKAIIGAGVDNPAMYTMALNMAKAMDSNVSKENLLKQSEFYLTEITNVYKQYVSQGKQKEGSLKTQKAGEEQSLQTELATVQQQLQNLQQQENSIKIKIGAIDQKYATQLHDISCKLEANDTAKREIFESINKVKRGINANL